MLRRISLRIEARRLWKSVILVFMSFLAGGGIQSDGM